MESKCADCKETKPITEFYATKRGPHRYCKPCHRLRNKSRSRNPSEQLRQRHRHSLAEVLASAQRAENGCLEIEKRFRDDNGYGRVSIGGVFVMTHRAAWIEANGEVPDGLLVCHKCDNPPCCDPNHLFVGTHQDNNDDCVAKGRAKHQRPDSPAVVKVAVGLRTVNALYYHRKNKGRSAEEIALHPRCESGRMKPVCRLCGAVGHNRTSHARVVGRTVTA